jgi:hypothetical protein
MDSPSRICPLVLALCLVGCLLGCMQVDLPSLLFPVEPAAEAVRLAQVPEIEQILAAPEEVEIGGRMWSLEPWLWRSYGFADPEGSPLWGWINLVSDTEDQIALGFVVTEVIVIFEQEDAWVALPDPWETSTAHVFGGPRWNAGSGVDIAVRIEELDGTVHWLMARDRTIFTDNPVFQL